MMKWTLAWVLRFDGLRFLIGLFLIAFSIRMIAGEGGLESSSRFVPAIFAFGATPFYATFVIGAGLAIVAWRRGHAMKIADPVVQKMIDERRKARSSADHATTGGDDGPATHN